MKRMLFVLLLLLSLPLTAVRALHADSAAAAIVIHADGDEVLYAHDENTRLPMASTTKLMTALVVLERCALDDKLIVSERAAGTEGSSMYLLAGEELTVEEVLYGLLLSSGNDAAIALAEHCAGDVESFVGLMNEKAAELGLKDTHFVNPNGLHDPQHYTTALELARLMAVCLQNADFCRISGTFSTQIAGRRMQNHNKLLSSCQGVYSGKTGYTLAAGRCLVTACERDGLRLICVTLSDRQDWADHAALYARAFDGYTLLHLEKGSVQGTIPLIGSAGEGVLSAVSKEEQRFCIPKSVEISTRLYLPPFLFAPVTGGKELGSLHLLMGEREEIIPLITAE